MRDLADNTAGVMALGTKGWLMAGLWLTYALAGVAFCYGFRSVTSYANRIIHPTAARGVMLGCIAGILSIFFYMSIMPSFGTWISLLGTVLIYARDPGIYLRAQQQAGTATSTKITRDLPEGPKTKGVKIQ